MLQRSPRANFSAFVLIALAAFAQRWLVAANSDVAWYLTVVEKLLDGQRLYADVIETNPPFSVLLYMPPVALARLTGMRAETMLDVCLILLASISVWLSSKILESDRSGGWLPVGAFAILTILPASCFGEREHIALILFFPLLALNVQRARDAETRVAWIACVGVACGVVLCIKPHFALAIIAMSLAAAVLRRSVRPLFAPELFIAGALFCAYLASTFVFYPAFWSQMMPLVRLLYLPARVPVADMLNGQLPLLLVAIAFVALLTGARDWRGLPGPRIAMPVAAIVGFLAAAVIQGKGWPYHFYPALGLMVLLVLGTALDKMFSREPASSARVDLACAAALCAPFWLLLNSGVDMQRLEAPLRALKANPRLLSMASDLGMSFPLARAVDGVWVGRTYSRWIPYNAGGLAAQDGFDASLLPAYRAAVEADRRQLAEDIRQGRPDVIIVERAPFDFIVWARKDSELASLLACFHDAGHFDIGKALDASSAGESFSIELWRADSTCAKPDAP